jgi:bisanhydrobacterioruberin hydratase
MEKIATSDKRNTAIYILGIFYLVGTIGFLTKWHPDFPKLTPFNLMLSLGIALYFHNHWNGKFIFWCLTTALVGFSVELVGVATGQIFGNYKYGATLGWQYLNTPLSISVNWLLTAYGCAATVSYAAGGWHWIVKAVAAALLMVSLDVLIEPIAMKTDMWSWENDFVPMQNYIGWFLTALPLQALFFLLVGSAKNKVAVAVLVLQFAFFAILNRFY